MSSYAFDLIFNSIKFIMTDRFKSIAFASLLTLWAALTFSSALTEISYVLCLLSALAYLYIKRTWPSTEVPRKVLICLLGYCLIVLLSYFWSEYPQLSFRGVLKVAQQISIIFLVVTILTSDKKYLRVFEKATLLLVTYLCINGYFQYFFGFDFVRQFTMVSFSEGGRVSASFKIYTMFAAFLILVLPYLLFITAYRFKDKKTQLFASFIVGMCIMLLILTRSRGAIVAICMSIFFILILKKQFKFFFITAVLLGISLFFVPKEHLLHLDIEGKEQSVVERLHLWDRALDVIKAKPLTGTGINTYNSSHSKYDRSNSWRVRDYYAHNGYLQLAAETGLPSLILFLLFLSGTGLYSYKIYRKSHHRDRHVLIGLAIGIIAFLILVMGDTVLHSPQPAMFFWLVFGVMLSYVNFYATNTIEVGDSTK